MGPPCTRPWQLPPRSQEGRLGRWRGFPQGPRLCRVALRAGAWLWSLWMPSRVVLSLLPSLGCSELCAFPAPGTSGSHLRTLVSFALNLVPPNLISPLFSIAVRVPFLCSAHPRPAPRRGAQWQALPRGSSAVRRKQKVTVPEIIAVPFVNTAIAFKQGRDL